MTRNQLAGAQAILSHQEKEYLHKQEVLSIVAMIFPGIVNTQVALAMQDLQRRRLVWEDEQRSKGYQQEHWPTEGEEGGPPSEFQLNQGLAIGLATCYAKVFLDWKNTL